jgi:diacylglycerol kinase family enzyme
VHAVLIENPNAGRVSPGSLRVVERALAATFELELVTTNARGHAASLAREAVEAGAKTIIAYGGDGTANEIVNGLLRDVESTEVVLAVLPGGKTNVLARNLGFANDLVEATAQLIQLVERGTPKHVTVGRIAARSEQGAIERDFAFAAGLVLDAEIVERADRSAARRRTNDAAFVYQGFRSYVALRRENSPQLVIDTPDGPQEAFWACIGTTDPYTYFRKRPLRVIPGAGSSGGIDLIAGKRLGFFRTLRWVQQAMTSGRHIGSKNLVHLPGQASVHLRAHRPAPLQCDGEYLGEVSELTAEALPGALPVWG